MKLTRAEKRWLDAYCREVTKQFPGLIDQLVIYGSKARGDSHPDSDLDVLLIVKDEAGERKGDMRWVGYLLAADGTVVPSILAYTNTEWAAPLAARRAARPFEKRLNATRYVSYESNAGTGRVAASPRSVTGSRTVKR